MPFLLLLVLMPACLQEVWSDPEFGLGSADRGAVLTWATVVFVIGFSGAMSWWTRRRLRLDPEGRELVLSRYGAWRSYHLFGLFALHGLTVYVFGWGWAVQTLLTSRPDQPLPPGSELLIIAPFVVSLFGSWFFFYDAEKAFLQSTSPHHDATFWTRWQYLVFQVRQNLALTALPIFMVVMLKAVRWVMPGGLESWGWMGTVLTLSLVSICYLLMPLALRLILGLRPLPQGPLRERLEAAAKRLNFKCSDILLWNTRGGVANALIVGIVPWLRYVIFTDRLLTEMTADEVEAVFGHEMGHVKHWHMTYYLAFIAVSMLASFAGIYLIGQMLPESWWEQLSQDLPHEEVWEWLTIGMVAVYIFSVFGFLSRRCERQADVYGCRAVSCGQADCLGHDGPADLVANGRGLCPTGIHTMVNALEKVAYLNGISRRKPGFLQSWQHGSIARRVDFLLRMQQDPSLEPRFQWRFGWFKGALVVGLLSVFAVCMVLAALLHQPL